MNRKKMTLSMANLLACASFFLSSAVGADKTIVTERGNLTITQSVAEAMGDGEVMALLNTINENEVLAAKAAEKKKVTGDVLEFAKMMEKEHTKNMKDTEALAKQISVKLMENKEAKAMKVKGAAELAGMAKLEGDDFSKSYVTAQVKDHQDALDTIDGKLIPNAKDASLKKHLTETRAHVAVHLDHAKKLQGGSAPGHADMPAKKAR